MPASQILKTVKKLESWGIETIACDLLDREAVSKLPQVPNIIFMAGRKFGTDGSESIGKPTHFEVNNGKF